MCSPKNVPFEPETTYLEGTGNPTFTFPHQNQTESNVAPRWGEIMISVNMTACAISVSTYSLNRRIRRGKFGISSFD